MAATAEACGMVNSCGVKTPLCGAGGATGSGAPAILR